MGKVGNTVAIETITQTSQRSCTMDDPPRGAGMDQLRDFLELVRQQGCAQGNFLGLLHVLIGRRIALADGTVVSTGQSWRAVAALLKKVRWAPEAAGELAVDATTLPPRDRERYWYMAIAAARVDSTTAQAAGDRLAALLTPLGYVVGPAPGTR